MIKVKYEPANSQNHTPEEIERARKAVGEFLLAKERQKHGFEALPPPVGSWIPRTNTEKKIE